jgi:hypothetical protein
VTLAVELVMVNVEVPGFNDAELCRFDYETVTEQGPAGIQPKERKCWRLGLTLMKKPGHQQMSSRNRPKPSDIYKEVGCTEAMVRDF